MNTLTLSAEVTPLRWFSDYFEWLTEHMPYLWQIEAFQTLVQNQIPPALALAAGSGKTSLIPIWLLALLYQKQQTGKTALPRRLIWVINRRAVVDQATEIANKIAEKFVGSSELRPVLDSISVSGGLGISTLRGEHEDNQEWSEDPSKPSIVIGTVDMVGSRLLLSGYGLSSRERAQHAGLIGNDVLLVNDEAQLSPAFARLIRLIESARKKAEVPLLKPFRTIHISATLDESSTAEGVFQFDMDREPSEQFRRVYQATKLLMIREVARADMGHQITGLAIREGAIRTIVMVDTPANAQRIAASIRKTLKTDRVLTMTGTMRGYERDLLTKNPLFSHFTSPGAIPDERVWLVCTSAGESGIDMSCDRMVTDLVPAERLIQRFGRLNRFGETTGEALLVYSARDVEEERTAATLRFLKSLQHNDVIDISCRTLSKHPPPREACSFQPRFARLHDRDLQLLSYTSLQHSRIKPTVDIYLHGDESDVPYTEIAWRAEAPYLLMASDDDREEWLNIVRVHSHERLREHTNIVVDLVKVSNRSDEIVALDSDGQIAPFSQIEDFRNALLILPPGLLGLSSGMLAVENDGAPYDVANEGLRYVRQGDQTFPLGSDTAIAEEQFDEFVKRNGMYLRLSISVGEDTELMYVQTTPERIQRTSDVYLDDHLSAVERNARGLAEALDVPADVCELIVRAAILHDVGKAHPNWQRAFGNNGGRPIAKLAKGRRVIRQNILCGLRHEFVSLLESINEGALTLQMIASHHKWGRPHFPERGYDRRRSSEENRICNLAHMTQFVGLQKTFGIWGLAYLESILRAADARVLE